jgi:hypothetical protein
MLHLGDWLEVPVSSPQTSEGTASTDPERALLPISKAIVWLGTVLTADAAVALGYCTTMVGSPLRSTERLRIPSVIS